MDQDSNSYLLYSRYFTIAVIYIASVITIGRNIISVLAFTLLFVLVFINSYLRVMKCENKFLFFALSSLLEVFIVVFIQYKFDSAMFIYLFITTVDVFLFWDLKQSVLLSVPLLMGVFGSMYFFLGSPEPVNYLINIGVDFGIFIFFAGASSIIRLERFRKMEIQNLNNELKRSKEELEEANSKLESYAAMIENISVLNERNRIAGEMHDTIGHELTALIMEMEICRKLIDKDVERTKAEIAKAYELAKKALSEVRASVKAIKPQNLDKYIGINSLEELINEFCKNTGILIKLDVSNYRYNLSPTIWVTLYRLVQESLTNCAKHGNADFINIKVSYEDKGININILDNGGGNIDFEKGIGLKTMEERVKSLGGSIYFSGNNGFCIDAFIPREV